MSKITNPATEANVSCGFFNSDASATRTYDATDFSKLFDGLINDGVFATIGESLLVKAGSGMTVNIGTGKAWFNRTWTINDDTLPITCDDSETLTNRIDAIVLEVDLSQTVRDNCFKCIKGTPSSNPSKPQLTNTEFVHQYALCYITIPAGSTEISQSRIENVIGTKETPFVTAILETVSMDELLSQWQVEFDKLLSDRQSQVNTFIEDNEKEYDDSIVAKEKKADESIIAKEGEFNKAIAESTTAYNNWSAEQKATMETLIEQMYTWYTTASVTLDGYMYDLHNKLLEEPASALQLQIDENTIKDILTNGFVDGTKTISEDGTTISSINSSGWTLEQTFTNNFLTITTVLKTRDNAELGRLVKNISSDGLTITSEFTII